MELYDPKTLLSLYGDGKIDVQTALHQALLHINQLYQSNKTASKDRQQLRNKVGQFEKDIKTLRKEVNRLQQQLSKLALLNTQVTDLTALVEELEKEVDSLKTQLQSK